MGPWRAAFANLGVALIISVPITIFAFARADAFWAPLCFAGLVLAIEMGERADQAVRRRMSRRSPSAS